MEARIIGSDEELGDVRNGLTIYGHTLTRDWSDIGDDPAQLHKLLGNRYVEVKGAKADTTADQDAEAAETIRHRLDELGATYAANASLKTLRTTLTKAEAAQAKAEEEAEEAAAEAARLAEAASTAPPAPPAA